MTQVVHERLVDLSDPRGISYRRVIVYADRQPAGAWMAWLEFVSAGGDQVVQTDRETTQSTLDGVAYWASALQPSYLDGAFARAHRRTADPRRVIPRRPPTAGGGIVAFRVRSADPGVTFRLMASRTLVPGLRRELHDGGTIVYVRAVEPALTEMPRNYEFLAHFRSENAAALVAQQMEADLRGAGVLLEIQRVEIALESEAIREALLLAAASRLDGGAR